MTDGPKPICAGCGVLMTTFGQPMCGECTRMITCAQPEQYCSLCLSSAGLTLKGGLHYTKDGGYAGKCTEQFA